MITYSIAQVANITGLNPQTLRAWEVRYGALVPERNSSGYRVYDKDLLKKTLKLK